MHDLAMKILGATGTSIFAVGQAGFIIKSNSGQMLAIDLYISDCVERIEGNVGFKRLLPKILSPFDLEFDAVICTHPHCDHFDIDAVPEMLSNGRTKLFCSIDCAELVKTLQMGYNKTQITYVKPSESYEVGDFHINFVNCDHGSGALDAVGVVAELVDVETQVGVWRGRHPGPSSLKIVCLQSIIEQIQAGCQGAEGGRARARPGQFPRTFL